MARRRSARAEAYADDCFVSADHGGTDRTYLIQTIAQAMADAKMDALSYIDGWIDSALCMNLTPDARAILSDMRVHVLAASARLASGERMEATTPLAEAAK